MATLSLASHVKMRSGTMCCFRGLNFLRPGHEGDDGRDAVAKEAFVVIATWFTLPAGATSSAAQPPATTGEGAR